ncbi:hypothetical protein MTO96_034337 [Rhipicephalus appendiculatus]
MNRTPRHPNFQRDEDNLPADLERVKRDIADMVKDSPTDIYLALEENDFTRMHAVIVGPEDTPYDGALLMFQLTCYSDYAMVHPVVKILTTNGGRTQLHPFVFRNGAVSLSILGTYAGPQWTPAQSLRTMLISIQSLLSAEQFYDSPRLTSIERRRAMKRKDLSNS